MPLSGLDETQVTQARKCTPCPQPNPRPLPESSQAGACPPAQQAWSLREEKGHPDRLMSGV